MLAQANPERSAELMMRAQQDIHDRLLFYEQMVEVPIAPLNTPSGGPMTVDLRTNYLGMSPVEW